jgi:hypothetical protein
MEGLVSKHAHQVLKDAGHSTFPLDGRIPIDSLDRLHQFSVQCAQISF